MPNVIAVIGIVVALLALTVALILRRIRRGALLLHEEPSDDEDLRLDKVGSSPTSGTMEFPTRGSTSPGDDVPPPRASDVPVRGVPADDAPDTLDWQDAIDQPARDVRPPSRPPRSDEPVVPQISSPEERSPLPPPKGGRPRPSFEWIKPFPGRDLLGRVRSILRPGEARGEPDAADAADAAGPSQARYANVRFEREGSDHAPSSAFPAGSTVTLAASIGKPDPRNVEKVPRKFPFVANRPVDLRVMVSSADFGLGGDFADTTIEGTFRLPASGPATTVDNELELRFDMRAPSNSMIARARINYYFRDALIQSQLIRAAIGDAPGGVVAVTDYTTSDDFRELDQIPSADRWSILLNDEPGGHTIVTRPPGKAAGARPQSFSVSDGIEGVVSDLRTALIGVTEAEVTPSKDELIAHLRLLAPLGRELHRHLWTQASDTIAASFDPSTIISIARPRSVRFSLPWTYVYDIPVEKGDPVCRLVEEWDGTGSLLNPTLRRCPYDGNDHERVFCPFGFWGFGHTLEAPPPTKRTDATIRLGSSPRIVVGETDVDVDLPEIDEHLATLRQLFEDRAGVVDLERLKTGAAVLEALERDLPIVYFLCHGYRPPDEQETWLGFGQTEYMTAAQFTDMATRQARRGLPRVWSKTRPLVVINACNSLAIQPDTLLSYVDAFAFGSSAMGVIGTEVKVPQRAAMTWASTFFAEFLSPTGTAASALAAARFEFLSRGSLFGLVYTAHCWAHLRVA